MSKNVWIKYNKKINMINAIKQAYTMQCYEGFKMVWFVI